MPWAGLYGHDTQRDALLGAYQRDRLGHSYLFTGPEGIGKKRFALTLAQSLLCETLANRLRNPDDQNYASMDPCGECVTCIQIKAGTYPDLHLAALPEDKQEFPIALMLELIQSLSLKPTREGSRRIAIIDDADVFNEESANCFLKTLEEPPPESLLILLGTAPERQLPTILSRCQVISFQPLSEADFQAAAQAAGIVDKPAEAQKLYYPAQGSLSRAQLLKDPEMQSITGEIAKAFQSPKFASVALGILLVKFAEGSKEAAIKRQRAHFAVEFIVQLLRAALLQSETGQVQGGPHQAAVQRLATLTNIEAVPQLIEACLEAEYHIDRRFQLALLLEAFADKLGRYMR
jgi:DNA polymerase-3 subunit delta'